MKYINQRTGVVIDSPCEIFGDDWAFVDETAEVQNVENKTLNADDRAQDEHEHYDNADEEVVDLSEMTVAELKEFAKDQGIDLEEATKKEDIKALIAKHFETAE